jgi:5-methylcytosine-specific restriction endonuclease McrA
MGMDMRYRTSTKALLLGGVPLATLASVGVGTVKQWTDDATNSAAAKADQVSEWSFITALGDGLGVAWSLMSSHPKVTLVLFGCVALLALASFLASKVQQNVTKDPQRMYTKAQRMQAAAQSGGQCEMEGFLWFRCRRPGAHGDHFYPHSLGGATDMANLVWACQQCNLRKGAKVPTWGQKIRLERRRKRYFPENIRVEVGNKVPTTPPREMPLS